MSNWMGWIGEEFLANEQNYFNIFLKSKLCLEFKDVVHEVMHSIKTASLAQELEIKLPLGPTYFVANLKY